MKRLRAETFCNHHNRPVAESVAEQERKKPDFARRNFAESWELFLLESFRRALLSDTISDRNFTRRHVAHQAQSACPAARISPQVDNQPVAVPKFRNGVVDFFGNIDPHLSWETSDFQQANARLRF